jgi:hypothetical protein
VGGGDARAESGGVRARRFSQPADGADHSAAAGGMMGE